VIPGNDDAIRSIRLVARAIADACIEGKELSKELYAKSQSDSVVVSGNEDLDVEVVHRRRRGAEETAEVEDKTEAAAESTEEPTAAEENGAATEEGSED